MSAAVHAADPSRSARRLARLDRYLMAQLTMLFGFFALVLVLVYWVNRAVSLFDQLLADGQSLSIFLLFSVLALPGLIRIVLPIAAFAATVYVTNRMASESELVVAQATGASAFRLARPVAFFGLAVSALMALLSHLLVPMAATELSVRQAEIAQNATARLLRDGQFLTPTAGITFYIREISPEGELLDIFLSDSRDSAENVTYTAASAYIVRTDEGPQLVMVDGLAQTLDTGSGRLVTTAFADLAYNLGTLISMPDARNRSAAQLMTWELLAPTPALEAETGLSGAALVAEAHERVALALQALVAALLGFATLLIGGFSRFGVWKQIVGAIFLLILIKVIETVCTGIVSATPGAWPLLYLSSGVGLALVAGLLTLADRPWLLRRRRVAA